MVHGRARLAGALELPRSPLLLAMRPPANWQFLLSGRHKLTTRDVTLELFRGEHHVPLLPPGARPR